ncbi:MAG: hypothetical protein ACR2KZ_16940 [Segetibacter sp.]
MLTIFPVFFSFVHLFPHLLTIHLQLASIEKWHHSSYSIINKLWCMTIDDFKMLEDHQKVQMVFDANKVSEKVDDVANYQLFQIDNFFVESKTSLEGKFKRSIRTFSLKELPVEYASEVLRMPIVKFEKDMMEDIQVNPNLKKKRSLAKFL